MSELPLVSIVIPCRNEVRYIGRCLESIVESTYPKDRLEVLVCDGMSEDGTQEIIREYAENHPCVRLVPNEKRITPAAFNVGIENATGELIMIMSAHSTYDADAIELCVRYSREYDADNVGGIWKVRPRDDGLMARAMVAGLSHRFGVGGATYRLAGVREPRWVDTAAFGCYRRSMIERIGSFNEHLVRGQDMEFNRRMNQLGGRTLLAPDVVINYFARTDFRSFCRHNLRNGVWAVLPFVYSRVMPISPRHLVPLAFVTSIVLFAILAVFWPSAWLVSAGVCAIYLIGALLASVDVARKEKDWRMVLVMPLIFAGLHVNYGIGSLIGVLRALALWPKRGSFLRSRQAPRPWRFVRESGGEE